MEIKKILFPTDFLEGSSDAMPYALDLAKKYGAKLYILHVIHDVLHPGYVPHISVDKVYQEIEEYAKKEIETKFIEELRGFTNFSNHIIKGSPANDIINFSKENDIDLIVMATHRRVGLDRIIFGSTAARVLRDATCPILTVRIKSE